MTEKINKKDNENSKNIELCSLFFNGKDEVKKLLTNAVKKARIAKKISKSKLNQICYFKEDKLDGCEVFEKDPSKMTQEIFCRAACALDLKAEDVLKLDFSEERLDKIVKEMGENKAGLVAALSTDGKKAELIPNQEVAPIYARIKILDELNES